MLFNVRGWLHITRIWCFQQLLQPDQPQYLYCQHMLDLYGTVSSSSTRTPRTHIRPFTDCPYSTIQSPTRTRQLPCSWSNSLLYPILRPAPSRPCSDHLWLPFSLRRISQRHRHRVPGQQHSTSQPSQHRLDSLESWPRAPTRRDCPLRSLYSSLPLSLCAAWSHDQ